MVYNVGQGYNLMGAGSVFEIETAPCYNNPYCNKIGLKMRESSLEYPSKLYSVSDTKENFMADYMGVSESIADKIDKVLTDYIGIKCSDFSGQVDDILKSLSAEGGLCVKDNVLDFFYWANILNATGSIDAAKGKGHGWIVGGGGCGNDDKGVPKTGKSCMTIKGHTGASCGIDYLPYVGKTLESISNAFNKNTKVIRDIGQAVSSTLDKYNCIIDQYNQSIVSVNSPLPKVDKINVDKIAMALADGVYSSAPTSVKTFMSSNAMLIIGALVAIIALLLILLLAGKGKNGSRSASSSSSGLRFRMF